MVTWHIENLKISKKDADEAKNMIPYLESIYGPMPAKQGKKHTYMGMEMYFTYQLQDTFARLLMNSLKMSPHLWKVLHQIIYSR